MEDIAHVKRLILNKLIRSNMWGGKHTPLDFVFKGMPEQFRMTHSGQRLIEKSMKELQNDEWVIALQKRTGKDYDTHISLNPRKIAEIQSFLAKT